MESTTQQTILVILAIATFIGVLLGWAYMLGFSNARIGRNEKDIDDNRKAAEKRFENLRHETEEKFEKISDKISKGFGEIYRRIDELPCRSPQFRMKVDGKDCGL